MESSTANHDLLTKPPNDCFQSLYRVGSYVIQISQVYDIIVSHGAIAVLECIQFSILLIHALAMPNCPFLKVASGTDDFTEGYGTFKIIDHDLMESDGWNISEIVEVENSLRLLGVLTQGTRPRASFELVFSTNDLDQLCFEISLDQKYDLKLFLTMKSLKDEAFYGLGEQLSHLNLKGQIVPVMVREDGVGRGLQPVNSWNIVRLIN